MAQLGPVQHMYVKEKENYQSWIIASSQSVPREPGRINILEALGAEPKIGVRINILEALGAEPKIGLHT